MKENIDNDEKMMPFRRAWQSLVIESYRIMPSYRLWRLWPPTSDLVIPTLEQLRRYTERRYATPCTNQPVTVFTLTGGCTAGGMNYANEPSQDVYSFIHSFTEYSQCAAHGYKYTVNI